LQTQIVKYGGPFILGSDALFWDKVGEFSFALELVQELQIPEVQILNTSPKRIIDYP